jgi:hypothetical protein
MDAHDIEWDFMDNYDGEWDDNNDRHIHSSVES